MSILDGVEGTHPDTRLTTAEVEAAWAKIAVDLPRPDGWKSVVLATPAVPGQHDPFRRYSGCPCDECFPPRDRFRVYNDDPTEDLQVGNPFAYARPLRRAVDDHAEHRFVRHNVVVEVYPEQPPGEGMRICMVRVRPVDATEPTSAAVQEMDPTIPQWMHPGVIEGPGFYQRGEGGSEELIIVRPYDALWTPEAARKDANDLIVWAITAELAAAGAKAQKAGAK